MFNTGNCASVPLVANIDGNGNNNGWVDWQVPTNTCPYPDFDQTDCLYIR